MVCLNCGYSYGVTQEGCVTCASQRSCGSSGCPKCGYRSVPDTALSRLLTRWLKPRAAQDDEAGRPGRLAVIDPSGS